MDAWMILHQEWNACEVQLWSSCSCNTLSGDEEVCISLGEIVRRHNNIGLALLHLRSIEMAFSFPTCTAMDSMGLQTL